MSTNAKIASAAKQARLKAEAINASIEDIARDVDEAVEEVKLPAAYNNNAVPNQNVRRLKWSKRAHTKRTFTHNLNLVRTQDDAFAVATAYGYVSTAMHIAAYVSQFHPIDVEKAARVLRGQGLHGPAERCEDALVMLEAA